MKKKIRKRIWPINKIYFLYRESDRFEKRCEHDSTNRTMKTNKIESMSYIDDQVKLKRIKTSNLLTSSLSLNLSNKATDRNPRRCNKKNRNSTSWTNSSNDSRRVDKDQRKTCSQTGNRNRWLTTELLVFCDHFEIQNVDIDIFRTKPRTERRFILPQWTVVDKTTRIIENSWKQLIEQPWWRIKSVLWHDWVSFDFCLPTIDILTMNFEVLRIWAVRRWRAAKTRIEIRWEIVWISLDFDWCFKM